MALGKCGLAIMIALVLGVQMALASRCSYSESCTEGEGAVSFGSRGNRKLLSDEPQREGGDEINGQLNDQNVELPNTDRRELTADTCSVTIQSIVTSPRCLHVGEIQLFNAKGEQIKPLKAELSDTLPPFHANNCIDGDEWTFCHSRNDPSNYIKVSYACSTGCSSSLSKVKILNRRDCCQNRLKGYSVWLRNAMGQVDQPVHIIKDTALDYTIPIQSDYDDLIQYLGGTPFSCSVTIKLREAQCTGKFLPLTSLELYRKSGERIPANKILPSPVLDLGCETDVIYGTSGKLCESRWGDCDPVFIAYYPCPSGKTELSKVVVKTDVHNPRKIEDFVMELRDKDDNVDKPLQAFPRSGQATATFNIN